ncbi:MAG: putative peptidoglycan glycosyltransferase FtsW [Akkermansiaceae bacterium]|jgi:cell division protein FtsW|tara:strand:+ start:10553 stop:11695 length:1143 start_codon:yes stop_codon:yes gene_type:complete
MGKGASIFICLAVASLITLGLVMLASASAKWDSSADQYSHLVKQAIWLGIGILVMTFMALLDYRILEKLAWLLFTVVCAALILCYIPGIGDDAGGDTRWIVIPVIGRFQPSEPAKLVIMIALASWFAKYQAETKSLLRGFVIPSLILGAPLLLILFEWDMGTSAGLGAAGLIVLFVAGTRMRYLGSSVVVALAMAYQMVRTNPNRWERIVAFLDLDAHKEGRGWQQWLGVRAFGNGGVEGMGLGNGVVKQMNLPEHHTDFIFPVIGEELGVFVTLGIIFCFVVIFLIGLGISLHASDRFGSVLGIGITSALVIPAMMNIGVTTASLPNTGLPLPFVSYGGSSLVFSLAMVGVLLSILRRSHVIDASEMPAVKRKVLEVRL